MVADEQYIFKPETKRSIFILLGVGILLFVVGVFMAMNAGEHHAAEGHHASVEISKTLVASTEPAGEASAEHHETAIWLKKIYSSLWHNNVFFTGMGLIGLFFVAIQYAAQAGWSAPIKRIPLAMGQWIPISGILMLGLWFFVKGDVFHWTHHSLYVEGTEEFDKALNAKSPYFFWPLHAGGFPAFYILRMVCSLDYGIGFLPLSKRKCWLKILKAAHPIGPLQENGQQSF